MSSSSDDGVDGVEPIEIVEKSISVTNGEQLRPSTFNVYSKASTHYVKISRCDKEWIRFLGFKGKGSRQLQDVDLWCQWQAAIEEQRKEAFLAMKQGKADDDEEELEVAEKADDTEEEDETGQKHYKKGLGRRAQLLWVQKHPFLKIALPVAPGSSDTHTFKVTNNQKHLGMAVAEKNFAWLRGYMEALNEQHEVAPPCKRQRAARES